LLALLQNDLKNLDSRISAEESKTSAVLQGKKELSIQLSELKTFLSQSRQGIFNVGAKAKKETKNFLKQKGTKSKVIEGAISESAVTTQKAAALRSIIKDAKTLAEAGHLEVAVVTLGGDASMLAPAGADKEKAMALIREAIAQKELELAAANNAASEAKQSVDALQTDLEKFIRQRDFLQSSLNRMIMDRFDTTVNATRYFEAQAKVLVSYKRLEAEQTRRTQAMKKEKAFLEKMIKDFSDRAEDLQQRVTRYSMRFSPSGGSRSSVRSRGRTMRKPSSASSRSRISSSRRVTPGKDFRKKPRMDDGDWFPSGPEETEDSASRPSSSISRKGEWIFDGAQTVEDVDSSVFKPRPLDGTPEHPEGDLHYHDQEQTLTDDLSDVDEINLGKEEIKPDYFPMEEGEDPAVLYEEMSMSDSNGDSPLKSDLSPRSGASTPPNDMNGGPSMRSHDTSLGVEPPHPPAPLDFNSPLSSPDRKLSTVDVATPKSNRSMSIHSEGAFSRPKSSSARFSMSVRRSSIYEFAKSLQEKDMLFAYTDLSSIDEEGNVRSHHSDLDFDNSMFGDDGDRNSLFPTKFDTEKLIQREMLEDQRLRNTYGKEVQPPPFEETR
jgi:hypothetical protein